MRFVIKNTAPFLLVFASLFCASCFRFSSAVPGESPISEQAAVELAGPEDHPALILRTGEQPLWFELAENGPRLIYSPGEASIVPFAPWPLARYITAMLAQGENLIMAVNREGFLALVPGEGKTSGDTKIYRAADPAYWEHYTASALFLYNDIPGALLYRNNFFSDLSGEMPVPPVRSFLSGETCPIPLYVPTLETLPPAEGWEPENLHLGPDGYWYFREVQKDAPRPVTRYFRTADLSQAGEEISLSAYRNSSKPEALIRAPAVLLEVLEDILPSVLHRGDLAITTVISPDFPGPRYFAPAGGTDDGKLTELSGFYRENIPCPLGETLTCAIVILPDGRGFYGHAFTGDPAVIETRPFNLPPLPEGFVYTGLGAVGKTLIAPWEERQEGSVGAAGFLAIAMDAIIVASRYTSN